MAETTDGFIKEIGRLRKEIDRLEKGMARNRQQFSTTTTVLDTFRKNIKLNTKELKPLRKELKFLTTQQKLHTEQVKKSTGFMMFQQRGTRNLSTSLSVLRSQLLIGAFALGTTQKIIGGLINSFAEYDSAVKRLTNRNR